MMLNSFKPIEWFTRVNENDLMLVGGKGLNLGLMTKANFPVPPGFIVTTKAYWHFLKETNLKREVIEKAKNINVDNTEELEKKSKEIRELIRNARIPEEISNEVLKAYGKLGEQKIGWLTSTQLAYVAVRSSATAEDRPEASFAGQQETYLNVRGKQELIKALRDCWASLFTARAIYYRRKNNFSEEKVGIAVVIQRMINSNASGVMFTADPTGDTSKIIIEAVFGLGEAIVSGSITPDNYVIDKKSLKILSKTISKQEWMLSKRKGKTEKIMLDSVEGKKQKLSKEKIISLARIGKRIEQYYKMPQDVEFAIENDELFIVQSRAITTLKLKEQMNKNKNQRETTASVLIQGFAASPGVASGKAVIIKNVNEIEKISKGDILVTKMTNPDWVPIMRKASAIITDEGGITCHAAIVSRELGIPCVVGTNNATGKINENEVITVNGFNGKIYKGIINLKEKQETENFQPIKEKEFDEFEEILKEGLKLKPEKKEIEKKETEREELKKRTEEEKIKLITEEKGKVIELIEEFGKKKTEELTNKEKKEELELISNLLKKVSVKVKVNVALPEAAERAAATGAAGVGLLRAEHLITAEGIHPSYYIKMGQGQELIRAIREGIKKVAVHFKDKPVWYRTFDARTDEFRHLKGGDLEPKEENPMIGWHGIRRDLDQPKLFKAQLTAVKQLRAEGFTNVGIMLPFVTHVDQVKKAKELMIKTGFNLNEKDFEFGVMVETPAAIWIIDELIEEGIKFISFGTNDLTQLTLGVDRNNEIIQKWFSELHPAVLREIHYVIRKCKKAGVKTSICGQAGSNPEMAKHLIHYGIDSISANIDAVKEIRNTIIEEEKNLLLGKVQRL